MDSIEPIRAVWEQYKHLDILLSDEEWMIEAGHPMAPQRKCLLDCWLAIKKTVGEAEKSKEGCHELQRTEPAV